MMTEAEARQILGVTENTPWEEIVKVFILPPVPPFILLPS